MTLFERINDLIMQSKTKQAINLLIAIGKKYDKSIANQGILISTRFENNEKGNRLGILDTRDYNMELSRVNVN